MKRNVILISVLIIVLLSCSHLTARAQADELQKFEVSAQFSSLSIAVGGTSRSEPGIGGRFSYNVTNNFALEAEGNIFPKDDNFAGFRNGGNAVEGLFGVKIGKRYKRFGIFAKARPGFISFSRGITHLIPTGVTVDSFATFDVTTDRLTHLAADLGGVLEFYPSRRIFTRMDIGDTIIRYGETTFNTVSGPVGGLFVTVPLRIPGDTTHNFQFSAGLGFRF